MLLVEHREYGPLGRRGLDTGNDALSLGGFLGARCHGDVSGGGVGGGSGTGPFQKIKDGCPAVPVTGTGVSKTAVPKLRALRSVVPDAVLMKMTLGTAAGDAGGFTVVNAMPPVLGVIRF